MVSNSNQEYQNTCQAVEEFWGRACKCLHCGLLKHWPLHLRLTDFARFIIQILSVTVWLNSNAVIYKGI